MKQTIKLASLLLVFLLGACTALGNPNEPPRTTTEAERAQGLSLVAQADDTLAIAAAWLQPSDYVKGKATLDALRKVIEASEFVPVGWSTVTGTALRLAAIWLLPQPPTTPG